MIALQRWLFAKAPLYESMSVDVGPIDIPYGGLSTTEYCIPFTTIRGGDLILTGGLLFTNMTKKRKKLITKATKYALRKFRKTFKDLAKVWHL